MKCRKCQISLIPVENWTNSRVKKRDFICKHCASTQALMWDRAHPERARTKRAKWKSANPDKNTHHQADRKAKILKQMPSDADHKVIALMYRMAKILEQCTGVKYHVDHITPLAKGGVHHQDNMQILRADLNLRKHARMDGLRIK